MRNTSIGDNCTLVNSIGNNKHTFISFLIHDLLFFFILNQTYIDFLKLLILILYC